MENCLRYVVYHLSLMSLLFSIVSLKEITYAKMSDSDHFSYLKVNVSAKLMDNIASYFLCTFAQETLVTL